MVVHPGGRPAARSRAARYGTPKTLLCMCQVSRVVEEEWSYIPVGGPLPVAGQPVTAFGAAANLVHPATGYSIARRRVSGNLV